MTGNTKAVRKDMNRAIILRLIRSAGRISRTQIAATLGITKSSVTAIVSGLADDGILLEFETGAAASSGGRKPIYLGINPKFGCVLGLDVRVDCIRCVLLDVSGHVLEARVFSATNRQETLMDSCQKAVMSFSDDIAETHMPVIGVGIGFPGYVDPFGGKVLKSVAFDIEQFDFSEPLSVRVGVPVVVDNDANCCAWGELVALAGEGPDDFLFVLPKLNRYDEMSSSKRLLGIGIGVVMDNAVRYGDGFASGEIFSALWRNGSEEQLSALFSGGDLESDHDVFARAALELLESLSVVASVLDPGRIYLGGYFGQRYEEVISILKDSMGASFFGLPQNAALFAQADFDEDDVARGAALMYLERLFGLPDYRNGRGFPHLSWNRIVELASA